MYICFGVCDCKEKYEQEVVYIEPVPSGTGTQGGLLRTLALHHIWVCLGSFFFLFLLLFLSVLLFCLLAIHRISFSWDYMYWLGKWYFRFVQMWLPWMEVTWAAAEATQGSVCRRSVWFLRHLLRLLHPRTLKACLGVWDRGRKDSSTALRFCALFSWPCSSAHWCTCSDQRRTGQSIHLSQARSQRNENDLARYHGKCHGPFWTHLKSPIPIYFWFQDISIYSLSGSWSLGRCWL